MLWRFLSRLRVSINYLSQKISSQNSQNYAPEPCHAPPASYIIEHMSSKKGLIRPMLDTRNILIVGTSWFLFLTIFDSGYEIDGPSLTVPPRIRLTITSHPHPSDDPSESLLQQLGRQHVEDLVGLFSPKKIPAGISSKSPVLGSCSFLGVYEVVWWYYVACPLISDLRCYLINCKNYENCTRHFTTSVSTNSTKSASVQHSIFNISSYSSSNHSSFRINNTTFRGGIESEGSCFDRSHEWMMLWAGHKFENGLDWPYLTPWFRWFRFSSCQLIQCISSMSTWTLQQQRFFSAVWHNAIMMLEWYTMTLNSNYSGIKSFACLVWLWKVFVGMFSNCGWDVVQLMRRGGIGRVMSRFSRETAIGTEKKHGKAQPLFV